MRHKKLYIPVLLLAITLLAFVQATILFPASNILSVSALETPNLLQVYSDSNCEIRTRSLDWGKLSPGQTRNIELYIRNEGNKAVVLDLVTDNWQPTFAEQNMTLSWDYNGQPIYKNQIAHVELALDVSPKISEVTNFSFDVVINCKECAGSLGEVAWEKILNASANTVYFIYGDPSLQSMAEATYDGTSGEILRSLCVNPQNYGFNTNDNWLLPSGAINTTTIHNSTILLFGGRVANKVVNYYETVKKLAPVTFRTKDNTLFFETQTGTSLAELHRSTVESPNYHEDLFTVMVFYDWEADNTFFVMYGINWKGTWASGIYFKEVISTNLNAYTNGYYIFHWVDDNKQDGIPQNHEIHQESVN